MSSGHVNLPNAVDFVENPSQRTRGVTRTQRIQAIVPKIHDRLHDQYLCAFATFTIVLLKNYEM